MKSKKVKIFIDGEVLVLSHFSGIGHYTADLVKAVDKLLFDDKYAHFKVELGVPFRLKHKIAKYEFENISVRGMPLPIRVVTALKWRKMLPPIELFAGKRVFVFPNYSSWPTVVGKNIPVIYDLSFVNHAEFVEPKNQQFLIQQVQHSVDWAKRILTISQNSKQEIIDHYKFPASAIDIAYPAVETRKFYRRSQQEIDYVKAKYGVFDNYILFVGNIEPRKNLITLLKAYERLPRKLQEKYSLLLIGAKGWLDDEIHEKIVEMRMRGLRVIQPTGYVVDDDLPALYSGAKAFAYVSRYEGFGIPPIEAMACGTPVVSSDNSSLPEAVGFAALRVKALDDAQIAESLEKLLTDEKLAQKLVKAGYEQITHFDWLESAKELLKSAEEANS